MARGVPPRWAFAVVLTAGMMFGTFGAPAMSVLAPFLVEELGLTRTQLGSLFAISAALGAACSPIAGRLIDVVGGRRMLAATCLLGGAATLGIAAAPGYGLLVAAACVSGLGWASGNPTTNKLIATHVPPGRRGLLIGLKASGVQAGFFLGGALLPLGAITLGWRTTLIITAFAASISGLVTLLSLPRDDEGPEPAGSRWRSTGRIRGVGWLAAYSFLMGAGMTALTSYLPLYANEEMGLSPAHAGAVASALGLTAVVSRILWSRSGEGLTSLAPSLALIATISIAAVAAIWAAPLVGTWLLWAGAVAAGATLTAWGGLTMLAVIGGTEARYAGRASGMIQLGFLAGLAWGPAAFGLVVDATGSYSIGWLGVTLLLAAGGLVTATERRSGPVRHEVRAGQPRR